MSIEPVIINYLITELQINSVYGEMQDNPEEEYIIVDKTGSDYENRVTTSTIAIQSHARSKARASEINELVKNAMDKSVELKDIYDCQLMSDYNFTNIEKKEYRYQAVFEITHRC